MSPETGRYLAGIGAVIRRTDGRCLLLRRAHWKDVGAGAWECVTGRLEQGEGFEAALHREVQEETGLTVGVDYVLGTSHFYRGPRTAEHEIVGVVFACTVTGGNFRQSPEHSEAVWATSTEARDLLTHDDPATRWMLGVLRRLEMMDPCIGPAVGALFSEHGVELL